MKWEDQRYQLIEETFTWSRDFTKMLFASDNLELVIEFVLNSDVKNICTASGGKVFYILDKQKGITINIDEIKGEICEKI